MPTASQSRPDYPSQPDPMSQCASLLPARYEIQQQHEDFFIATIAALLAWIITLALKMVFSS